MKLRLLENKGCDGTEHAITVLNDTGSNITSVLSTDLRRLGKCLASVKNYRGWNGVIAVFNADGVTRYYPGLLMQIQLVSRNSSENPNWIYEQAILKRSQPG
jgi:hypothetical protein